jgi:hypothetical protein
MTAVLLTAWLAGGSMGATALLVPVGQHEPHASMQKLGTVHFATSCAPPAAPTFNRAMTLLHSFEFPAATEGFRQTLAADPGCAIAYWGIALSAWGNPFAAGIKPNVQIQRGLDAIRLGRTTGTPTARERGYVEAAAQLFEHADSMEQHNRLLAYRDAMKALAAREPDDTEAAIFYALSLAISAEPTDKTYASQLEAGAILERLFAAQPDHPGLAHYIIHAYDVPALAPRALDAARRYSEIAPEAPHALHMPSHTFTRVGDWDRSIEANVASAAAARRQDAVAEELHASDYQVYAYLQTGQDAAARRLRDSLPELAKRFDPSVVTGAAPPMAAYFALAAIPARYALERGAWAEAARLEVHPTPVAFADAITHFARGLGAARSGDLAEAKAAIDALAGLRDLLMQRHELYWGEQVDIERRGVTAWLALAEGRQAEALAEMRTTTDREGATEKNAITPGPLAPARELLGEMLLALHQPTLALAEFQASLTHEPNRFRSLAGAARAAAAAGNQAVARQYEDQLRHQCTHADQPGRPELADARPVP